MQKTLIALAVVTLLVLHGTASAQVPGPAKADVMQAVHAFVDGFN